MRHVFMPGKFVFPGGRVDATDSNDAGGRSRCIRYDMRRLLVDTKLRTETDARALALAAIRETFEETGLVIGTRDRSRANVPTRSLDQIRAGPAIIPIFPP